MRLSNVNLLSVFAAVTSALPYSGVALNATTTQLSSDEQNALNIHNGARVEVNVPALSWDSGLQQKAQDWANHLASQGGGNLVHSGAGENLFAEWGVQTNSPLVDGTNAWYHEKANYHHETIPDGDFESYGHWTQMTWSSTTHVGIASATSADGWIYVAAEYSPAGNYVGQTPY